MMAQDQLLSYTKVHLDRMPKFAVYEGGKHLDYCRSIAQKIGNQPVELIGEASMHTAVLSFIAFFSFATEIIYRKNDQEMATVLFTLLDPAFIRPSFVVPLHAWQNTIPEHVQEKKENVVIHLESFWKTAGEKQPQHQMVEFLKEIHSFSPVQQRVHIVGEIDILPTLMAIAWFAPHTKQLQYQDFELL